MKQMTANGRRRRAKSVVIVKVLGILLAILIVFWVANQSGFLQNLVSRVTTSFNQGRYALSSNAIGTSEENKEADWKLVLVNRWNPIAEEFSVDLLTLSNHHRVDERIYPDLQKMFDDARAAGMSPTISSAYRSTEEQQQTMDEEIAKYQQEGYSYRKAKEIAEEWVAIPGTSEHQTGLAVDITSEEQEPAVLWQWLNENSYKYGFVVRYPENKTTITGINPEPWHFRYVGEAAAAEMHERGICLEEYLYSSDVVEDK